MLLDEYTFTSETLVFYYLHRIVLPRNYLIRNILLFCINVSKINVCGIN